MKERKKAIVFQLLAFFILLFLSAYRQASMQYIPDLRIRHYIVYAGYVFLIVVWVLSLRSRVTQRTIYRFLLGEAVLMWMGLTIRFVQDAFLQENLPLLRLSGYFVSATLLPIFLMGFFASLGLGQGENYQLPKKWYWIFLPVLFLTALLLTDAKHHFVFRILPEETEPNIFFHPGIGLYLICAMAVLLILMRAIVIYQRNKISPKQYTLSRFLPLAQVSLLAIYMIPYLISSFYRTPEIIEFFAGIYYLEVLSWELYILTSLVPVNMEYTGIFEYATVGMQITDENGRQILCSQNADSLTGSLFEQLKQEKKLVFPDKELILHENGGTCFVWRKDIRQLQEVISMMKNAESELSHEGMLLQEEIRVRTEETKVTVQNQIYSLLSEEVVSQLVMMREIAKKCRMCTDNLQFYRILFVIGTYVKRRCNLRLIEQECGSIPAEDIRLCFQDMVFALRQLGAISELTWYGDALHSAEFWICAFDQLEILIEHEDFDLRKLDIVVDPIRVSYLVQGRDGKFRRVPEHSGLPYRFFVEEKPGAYLFSLEEEMRTR